MKVLCLLIPRFPLQVELKRHPEMAQRPVVLGGFPHERKRVMDCSKEAAAFGVSAGMTIRQASYLCPDAIFLPLDDAGYAEAFEGLLDILDEFSPLVEMSNLGKAFIDIYGTGPFGSAQKTA